MTSAVQKSECCSATGAVQHSENCSATSFFACGMLQGWCLEGWGLGLADFAALLPCLAVAFRASISRTSFCAIFWGLPKSTRKNPSKIKVYLNKLGKSKWGLSNGGLGCLSSIVYNCLQLSPFCYETSFTKAPKRPQMCTIAHDCARVP